MYRFFKLFTLLILLFSSLTFTPSSFSDELIIEPEAGRAPLLNAIEHATSSVDLVMYGFTDETFVHALIQAKKAGKQVSVLLEPQPYKAASENTNVIRQLRAEHINLIWPDKIFKLTHQKTFILDQQTAIVMTFNLTHSSFSRERNFALIITDPNEVKEITHVFNADMNHQQSSVDNPDLLWSPNNSREKMLQFIQSAHSTIKIYAQDITDYQLIGALANAARHGIEVKILLSVSPEKSHSGKFNYLKKAGVIIHNSRDYYIHAKVILIDDQKAILGSINFTKPSLNNNRELSVITKDPRVIRQLKDTFDNDWHEQKSLTKYYFHILKQFLNYKNKDYKRVRSILCSTDQKNHAH